MRQPSQPLPKTVSLALVALAALMWGLAGGVAGILMARGWEPLLLSLHRGLFGLACIALWLLVARPAPARPSAALVGWALVAGVGVAGNFGFYFMSIRSAGVAVAATLMYSAPAFVFLTSVLLRMERATPGKALAVAGVIGGLGLLTGVSEAGPGAVEPWGVVAGLLAGVSYAVFLFGFKAAARHGPAAQGLAIALVTEILVLLPFVDRTVLWTSLGAADLPWFVVLGVFGAGLSFLAYIVGLRGTAPTVAAVLALVEPVTASLTGVLVLGETLSAPQLVGAGLILASVAVVTTSKEKAPAGR